MPRNASIVSLTLLTLASAQFSSHGKHVGARCTIDNSRQGTCQLLQNCPVVYQQLLSGTTPNSSCGFLGFEPIVCCPTSDVSATIETTSTTTTTGRTDTPQPLTLESRGAVARAKCAENAKSVYGLKVPPTLVFDRTPVNVSRCAVKKHTLVIGGKPAEPKEFPHMAAIGFGEKGIQWLCGGSLISDRIVLTAAHCTYQSDLGSARWVRVGVLNLAQSSDNAQTIRISERIRHPQYKRPAQYHDIAIMKLQTAATYNEWVRPACLPVDLPDVGTDNKAVATGWGLVDWADESGSDNLLKVTLNLVPHASCNASFSSGGSSGQLAHGIVNDWQICAGEVGKDTCQGDSGGPLSVFNTNHECMYNVAGVTSFGRLCGSIVPGVYTRVYHYIPWIERTAWPEYF